MNSVELVKRICKERKIAISRLEKDCGFSNGYIRKLQEGKFPSDRILVIAKYLNLPVSYLMTGEDSEFIPQFTAHEEPQSKEAALTPKDERDIKRDLDSIMDKLTNAEDGPAAYDGQDLSPEAAELFRDELEIALKRLKLINKEKYNPHKNKK